MNSDKEDEEVKDQYEVRRNHSSVNVKKDLSKKEGLIDTLSAQAVSQSSSNYS